MRDDNNNNAEVHEPSYKRLRSNDNMLYDDLDEEDEIEVDYGDEELIDEDYFL